MTKKTVLRKVCYISGVICLLITFGWWLISVFKIFSEFYKYSGLEILILPLFKLFINPFLWISILLLKLAERFSPDAEETPLPPSE